MLEVKNVFRFIQWQFNKMSKFGKLSLFSISSSIMSMFTMKYETVSDFFLYMAFAGIFAMFAALFYTIIGDQYGKFKAERQGLFDTIKHSDKQN